MIRLDVIKWKQKALERNMPKVMLEVNSRARKKKRDL
jgi:hypothetical protein